MNRLDRILHWDDPPLHLAGVQVFAVERMLKVKPAIAAGTDRRGRARGLLADGLDRWSGTGRYSLFQTARPDSLLTNRAGESSIFGKAMAGAAATAAKTTDMMLEECMEVGRL